MNSEDEGRVLSASSALKLRDIALYDARFERPTNIFPAEDIAARQEFLRGVQFLMDDVEHDGDTRKILQIVVQLGTRIVADVEGPEPTVYFLIEAKFLVEYEMTDVIDEEAIKAFADYNAVHNVWPFWRQHVFDIVQRARIPHMEIPLFAGTRS